MNRVFSLKRKINNRLLKYSYPLKLTRLPASLPNSLDVETTNHCSLQCFKCPRQDMARPQGSMPLELFEQIIHEAHPEVSFCWLHLFGDPLLNRHLPQMIKFAASHEIRCGISTNGMVLTEKMSKRLCETGLDTIIISLDAAEKHTYDKVRKGGDFERVVKNTEKFLQLPETKNIRKIIIQLITYDLNRGEVERFIEKWRGPDRKVHIKEEDSWAGHFSSQDTGKSPKRIPCRKLWGRLTIDWQGNVTICCRDFKISEKLGNVRTDSLKSIWNSTRMIEIRKMHVNSQYHNLPLCKNCREWEYSLRSNFTEY